MGIATLVLQSAANQNRSIASGNRSLIPCGLARNDTLFYCVQQIDKLKFEVLSAVMVELTTQKSIDVELGW